jgi:very-short-patch-repair endonuclease/RecA/RadA recombinase
MQLSEKLLNELRRRLKVGNRRSVHLNAIPGRSNYKFDLSRLSYIEKELPKRFIDSLLSECPLKFKISWKDNVPDLNTLFIEDQARLIKITKSFENLINQISTIESEKGINTFGFGFPILIRRDKADNKLTVAPVFIWSLRFKRTSALNTWEIIRSEEDDIYLNEVLINHLKNDSGVDIAELNQELIEDGLLDKNNLINNCLRLLEAINTTNDQKINEILSSKVEEIVAIGDKNHYEQLLGNSTNALLDFGGIFSIFEVQKQNIINDYNDLLQIEDKSFELDDLEDNHFQPISSIDTDPSQQGVLHAIERKRNILIQGPPGTGKSQTLTALLVNALENKKKVLVVCEKRTALEVLHNALKENGIGNLTVLLKDIIKDRKLVVDSVRERIVSNNYTEFSVFYIEKSLSNIITKASSIINSINSKHKKVGEEILDGKKWSDIVGEFLSYLKETPDTSVLNFEHSKYSFTSDEFHTISNNLVKAEKLFMDYRIVENESFLNHNKFKGDNPYHIESLLKESFSKYLLKLNKLIDLEDEYRKICIIKERELLTKEIEFYTPIVNEILNIWETHKTNFDFQNEKKSSSVIFKLYSFISKRRKIIISDQIKINELFLNLNNLLAKTRYHSPIDYKISILEKVTQIREFRNERNSFTETQFSKIEESYTNIDVLAKKSCEFASEQLNIIKQSFNELIQQILNDDWILVSYVPDSLSDLSSYLISLSKRFDEYLNNDNDPFLKEFNWYRFYNSLSNNEKEIVNQLKNKSNWRKIFLVNYLDSLLKKNANLDLPVNENDYIELEEQLKELKSWQIKYIKQFWQNQQSKSIKEFESKGNGINVENIYNKKSSTKHRRLSLRQIVQYDIDLFTSFFPVILTTPDVSSNLFQGADKYFDIVMFDEASQLRLEDNLPAVLKGKQVIIAGDEHQMPPSNYFSKIFDGSVEDEEEIDDEDESFLDTNDFLLSCESLLDFASELQFEKRFLDFHYRSRHPYLIDFSNYAFYKQRLKPLPNQFDYNPIKYIQVNGTFSDHTNEAEAEMVLSILEHNINRLPSGEYPSVGVATFNIAQRDLIKSKILDRKRNPVFSVFNNKIIELEENGLFIKNLENIQGDERDVIIISTTYGISKDGRFAQRFGPINHSKGYKLLNVIITRAKFKVYVCSSIPESFFLNYKDYLIAEGSNNKRAVFYAYLAYSKAVSEKNDEARIAVLTSLSDNSPASINSNFTFTGQTESPFEEEVYGQLISKLGEEQVFPQMQFAGFRIDLVYVSKIKGVPKIAIECDGAKYHSSREAYLYDIHRQKILENHGFVFHRIWSTNWWRRPEKELQKLLEFISNLENKNNNRAAPYTNMSSAFSDDMIQFNDHAKEVFKNDNHGDLKKTYSDNANSYSLFPNKVHVTSIVTFRYLHNNKELKVQIVDVVNQDIKKDDFIQITPQSPIAKAIMGKIEGDIVFIEDINQDVQILKVVN